MKRKKKQTRFRKVVLAHLHEVKGGLLVATLSTVGYALMLLLAPWPLKIIFDHILSNQPLPPFLSFLAGVIQSGKVPALVVVSSSIVLIAVLRAFFGYSQLYLTTRIGYRMVHVLRRELFAHLQRLSLSFHTRSRSGELLTKITGDTNVLRDAFAEWAVTFTGDVLLVAGMIAIMFFLNWRLALIVLASVPLVLGTFLYLYRKIKASAKRARRQEGKVASRLSEILTAVSVVQAFGQERYEEERFETATAQTLEEGVRTARREAAAMRAVEILSALGIGAVVLFGSLQVLEGGMTLGSVLIFASYLRDLYRPVRHMTRLSAKFSKAAVSAERIEEMLEIEPEIRDDPHAIEASNLQGEIVFENVSFDYGDGRAVLNDVSFAIRPDQRVALVGVSGAGKSTLASLILRLYDPQGGSISIDGVNVKKYRRESLRREIGIVLQDSILFGATVRENIAYGKLDATDEEIVAAAGAANAHEFVLELEKGYDTVLGERGASLSGGQRRRIGIARALIRGAPILILDEPMAGLDIESETKVREALGRLMAGKSCLLITHDLAALTESDLVLVLEDGRIVERGRHVDLMAGSLRYRKLYELKARRDGDVAERPPVVEPERHRPAVSGVERR